MKPAHPDVKLTYDDYVHFPDDGLRHELIDGEDYVTATPIRKHLYERVGVDEYWIIDPELDEIDVYRHVESRYQRVAQLTLEAGDVLTTPLLPGSTLPLSTIFED